MAPVDRGAGFLPRRETSARLVQEWRVLFSRKEAILEDLRAIEIHGARFYDILFCLAETPDAPPESGRIGAEMIYANPRAGDRVMIEQVANVVLRVDKL